MNALDPRRPRLDLTRGMSPTLVVGTLTRSGLLDPGRPDRIARQLLALRRWGYSLAGEVRQAAARSPQQVAVVDQRRGAVTYQQLLEESEHVAAVLLARGLRPGSRVGLLARNHVGAVEVMVAASALGLDLVLLNTGLAGPRLAEVATEQRLADVVHDDEFAAAVAHLPGDVARIGETELGEAMAGARDRDVRAGTSPPTRRGRTIVLTSGTTGAPKGAARPTPRGFGPLVSILDRIPVHVGDRMLLSAPVFHTWGYAGLQLAIGLRCTTVLQRHFDPEAARDALRDHRIQVLVAVPVMLQRLLALPGPPDAEVRRHLRVVATSGSAYPSGFATRFLDAYGEVLHNLYGSTEASWVCIATPADLRRHPDTAGIPPHGTRVALLDEAGQPVPEGAVGRVFVGNDMVFGGYTSGPDKERVDGMVDTGDLGHVLDGLWFVDGRADDLVVSGGENVHPREVESAVATLPGVREVAVVGVPDAEYGQRLAAYVVRDGDTSAGAGLTADTVRDHVRARRARHCVPRDVFFVDELPRNATGKVLGRDLRGEPG